MLQKLENRYLITIFGYFLDVRFDQQQKKNITDQKILKPIIDSSNLNTYKLRLLTGQEIRQSAHLALKVKVGTLTWYCLCFLYGYKDCYLHIFDELVIFYKTVLQWPNSVKIYGDYGKNSLDKITKLSIVIFALYSGRLVIDYLSPSSLKRSPTLNRLWKGSIVN